MGTLKHITDDTFEQEIQGATPVLVDLWAEWCGPCRMIGPVLEQIAAEQGEKLKIVKLNVDEHYATPARFGVTGIPTLLLFKDGKLLDRIVGFLPKPHLLARLQPYLQSATTSLA